MNKTIEILIVYLSLVASLFVITLKTNNFTVQLIIVAICSVYFFIKNRRNLTFNPKNIFISLFFIVLCGLGNIAYFAYSPDYVISNPHNPFGSIETGRYANIAKFIIEHNYIPSLKQNYLQSIMSAALHKLLNTNFVFNLFLILLISKFLLAQYFFNIFSEKLNKYLSVFLVVCLFFCGISIQNKYYINVDTGFPIMVIGYFDVVFSILSILVFINLNKNSYNKNYLKNSIFYYSWIIYSPQNLFVVTLYYLYSFIKYRDRFSLLNLGIIFSSLVYGYIFCGFLLSHSDPYAVENIHGLNILIENIKLTFLPGLDVLKFNPLNYPGFDFIHISQAPFPEGIKSAEFIKILWDRFFFSLKTHSLVFLMLIIFIASNYLKMNDFERFREFYYSAIVVFIFSFLFGVSGFKWQMSRFSSVAIYLSIASLFLYYLTEAYKSQNSFKSLLIFALIFYLSIKNIYGFLFRAYHFFLIAPSEILVRLWSV
jgi:hypothetical protein